MSVFAVAGAGGIGKTALAVHAAHRVRQRFPDGQLYVDLRGTGTSPVDPADALARLLRDLGVPADTVAADVDERAARYRSVLTGRRVLIVLDDAAGADQVRPLIPGDRGCCVLVTSRALLTDLAGAHHVSLDVLSDEDAAELFAQIVGRSRADAEPQATADVLAACAGLPLAIRIAGARLASRPQWTIRHMSDRLADERGRLGELTTGDLAVRASFQLSYDNLETRGDHKRLEPARTFRLLGLVGGPDISLPAAAALIERSPAEAEAALELLVDTNLLGTSIPGRYRLHDLIRIVAAERPHDEETEQQRTAAVRRLLTWYVNTAHAAAQLIPPLPEHTRPDLPEPAVSPPEFGDRDQAVAWCDTELPNLALAARAGARMDLHSLVVQLATSLRGYFYLRKPRQDWTGVLRLGVACAQTMGDRDGEYRMTSNLGVALGQTRQLNPAIATLEQALRIARELGHTDRECATLGNIAVCYSANGRDDLAVEYTRQALEMTRDSLDNRAYEAIFVNNLGEHHRSLGELDESLNCLRQALEIKRELDDDYNLSSTLDGLAMTYLALHRYQEAADHAREAVDIRTRLDDRWGMAESLDRLATALRGLDHPDEAQDHWHQALTLYESLGSPQADTIRAHLTKT